jgi:glycosyltransferase involved in cell wall biosynthesis
MAELAVNSLFGIAPYELHEGYQDNIPNKIVEYLSYGLPVISNINNSITAFLNQEEKIIFQYQNEIELLNILTLKIKSNNLKTKIKKTYDENFSERRFIEKFEKIIVSIK